MSSEMWVLWDVPNQSCQNCFYKSLVFDNLTRLFGICDLEKPILTFPPHSILSIQTFKIYLKIRNFLQKVTYDVTHANTETAGSKTSLEKKLNCVVKPPLASRPTEAVKFVEAVEVRLVALILLSRTEENLFEVVPRLFDEFFFQTFLSAERTARTSTWHTDKVFSKRLACFAFAYQTWSSHSSRTKKCDRLRSSLKSKHKIHSIFEIKNINITILSS